jgi:crotonobetainyl-CoA:carnitine CoA-transferase CaiB-like acyl-CoA transferase
MDDPRFSTLEERTRHKDELNSILSELFVKHKAEDLLEVLYEEDIQAAPVNTVDKVVVDPQVVHNGMIISVPHSLGGEVKMAGNPIKMASIHQEDFFAAPTMGEHTEEILKGLLGYSDGKVQALKEEQDKHADELARHIPKTR